MHRPARNDYLRELRDRKEREARQKDELAVKAALGYLRSVTSYSVPVRERRG